MSSSSASGPAVGGPRRGRPMGRGIPRRCPCGEGTVLRTSTTPTNPGRLFYVCPFRSELNKNHLFKWTNESIVEEVEDIEVGLKIIAGDVARLGREGHSSASRTSIVFGHSAAGQNEVTQLTTQVTEIKAMVSQHALEIQVDRAKLVNMKRFMAFGVLICFSYYVINF